MKGYKASIYQVYTRYIFKKRTYIAPPLEVRIQENALIARFDSGWLQGVLGPGDVNYQRTQHRAILNQGCSGPEPPWGLKGAEWGTNLNNNRGRGEKHFAATAIVLEQAL